MKKITLLLLTVLVSLGLKAQKTMIEYKTININGTKIFYREAGDKNKPAVLLLHGFPSSSFMFRDLIPMLMDEYHLIAPDYLGFGQTKEESRAEFQYTFDNIARLIDKFTESVGLKKYAMYVFDYGAPIGYRLAMWHPECITAIISQNGNAYEEGLGTKWADRKKYWANPTPELRKKYKSAYDLATIKGQYTFGTPENSVAPDGYTLDYAYVHIGEREDIQDDLIFDYQSNVRLYPAFQEYFRKSQVPLLAVWGKNDPSFIPQGAKAFKKDLPDAEIHFVESGHFALESHSKEIATLIKQFLNKIK